MEKHKVILLIFLGLLFLKNELTAQSIESKGARIIEYTIAVDGNNKEKLTLVSSEILKLKSVKSCHVSGGNEISIQIFDNGDNIQDEPVAKDFKPLFEKQNLTIISFESSQNQKSNQQNIKNNSIEKTAVSKQQKVIKIR